MVPYRSICCEKDPNSQSASGSKELRGWIQWDSCVIDLLLVAHLQFQNLVGFCQWIRCKKNQYQTWK
jgi:hypothetical protein